MDVCPVGAPLVIGLVAGLGRRIGPPVAVDLMPSGALAAVVAVLVGIQGTTALDVVGWAFINGGDHRPRFQVR
jgi:hypothetical protein